MKIYQIDSSARKKGSSSRALAKKLLDKIKKPGDEVIYRDLDDEMLFVSGLTESGMKIDEKDQTEDHKKMFKLSDILVKELKESDVIIISAPIYNHGPPATLKAWCDLAARIGETFRFKPNGRRDPKLALGGPLGFGSAPGRFGYLRVALRTRLSGLFARFGRVSERCRVLDAECVCVDRVLMCLRGHRNASRNASRMVRSCAQTGQAAFYYQYHHVGHVGGVRGTRAGFVLRFCKNLEIQPNVYRAPWYYRYYRYYQYYQYR